MGYPLTLMAPFHFEKLKRFEIGVGSDHVYVCVYCRTAVFTPGLRNHRTSWVYRVLRFYWFPKSLPWHVPGYFSLQCICIYVCMCILSISTTPCEVSFFFFPVFVLNAHHFHFCRRPTHTCGRVPTFMVRSLSDDLPRTLLHSIPIKTDPIELLNVWEICLC